MCTMEGAVEVHIWNSIYSHTTNSCQPGHATVFGKLRAGPGENGETATHSIEYYRNCAGGSGRNGGSGGGCAGGHQFTPKFTMNGTGT